MHIQVFHYLHTIFLEFLNFFKKYIDFFMGLTSHMRVLWRSGEPRFQKFSPYLPLSFPIHPSLLDLL
jgi:hypothetical protein